VTDPPGADFLSGTSGQVFGVRATSRALLTDAVADLRALASGQPWRLRRAARAWPRRQVLALAVERVGEANLIPRARRELARSKHRVSFEVTPAGDRGKFENLNVMLGHQSARLHDWLLVVDDDVWLPHGFLDAFVFLAERFGLALAQPAHRARSHAAWPITRRRPGSVVRETGYVEIGPVVGFHRVTFDALLPFPDLRFGWGLEAHWAAIAKQHGWPIGVLDAVAIRHGLRRIGAAYDRDEAIAEGMRFLADRPYVAAAESQRTFVTHRTWA
jgi:hypothetical protein